MKIYRTHKFASPPTLSLDETDAPKPEKGQLLIEVRAAGIHLADFATLAGERNPRPELPFAPGMEGAGRIAGLGGSTKGFKEGDRVVFFQPWGSLAEQIVVDSKSCLKVGDGLTDGLAASLPFAYAGALIGLRDKARLEEGETLLVLGAGGLQGLAALEIGKALGANVIASAAGDTRGDAAIIAPSLAPARH